MTTSSTAGTDTDAGLTRPQLRIHAPGPLHISDSLKELIVRSFTAADLRHLASLMEDERNGTGARRQLSDEGLEALADIILNKSSVPTVGFWRRYGDAA